MKPCQLLILTSVAVVVSCTPTTPPAEDDSTDDNPQVFEILTGGAIEFPAGSLAAGADLKILAAESVPLPAGVSPSGSVVSLELDRKSDRPATLRLPAPVGAQTDEVFVFQVESDGTTTLLSTEVEGGVLVATTDYFTLSAEEAAAQTISVDAIKAAIGLRDAQTDVPGLSPPRQGRIVGPSFMSPGQVAVFVLNGLETANEEALDLEWSLYGSGVLEVPSTTPGVRSVGVRLLDRRTAVVEATEPGRIDLAVSYVDPRSGTRGFAARAVSVQGADVGEVVLAFLAGETERIAGVEEDGFAFGVLGLRVGSATFAWDYGDGGPAATGSTDAEGRLTFDTPAYTYDTPGAYTAAMSATYANGATGTLEIPVTVRPGDLEVAIEGPSATTVAASPFATTAYQIVLSNHSPFTQVAWELFPGSQRGVIRTSGDRVTASLFFSEPGSYVLSARAADGLEETATEEELASVAYTASFARPVTVTGGSALTLTFTGNASTAAPNQLLEFGYEILGGQLIVSGLLQNYRLEIDWGDGEDSTLILPADGTKVGVQDVLTHAFSEVGQFVVEATAVDALGNRVSKQWTVTVTGEPTEPPDPEPEPFDIVSITVSSITPLNNCEPPDLVDITLELEGPVDYPAVVSFEATVCGVSGSLEAIVPCFERLATVDSLDGKSFTLSGPSDLVLEGAFECFDLYPEYLDTTATLRFRATVTDAAGRQDTRSTPQIFCCDRGAPFCPDTCP